MKGKIGLAIVLWIIWGVYAFLVYPLLQNTGNVTSNLPAEQVGEVRSIGDTGEQNNNSQDSSPAVLRGQNDDTRKPVASGQQLAADTICFHSTCFDIEIADTPAARQQWLMHRSSLPQNAGMLFVFDRLGSHGFWMKNTLIPLDIIWMDENFVVVDTATMTPCIADPCPTYTHDWQAAYALEINAGVVEEYGIQQGDILQQK